MDPISLALGGAGALGGLLGSIFGGGLTAQQQQAIQNEIQSYQSIGVPPDQALQVVLQKYQSAGNLTPQTAQTMKQGSTNLAGVQTNPQFSQAQLNALTQLQQMGSNGGETLADKANLNNTLNQVASKNQGTQQAILQNAQERGQLGSGQSLSAQLQAAQGAANQSNQAGLDINAQAQNRALQALMGAGQMGGQMQQQQYGQLANAAKAQDAISQFNTANSQNVQNQNTAMKNYANQYNLQNQQNINNQNTNTGNQQALYNSQQIQQNFNDQIQKANGLAGAYNAEAGVAGQNAQNTRNQWGGIGQGLAQIGGAYQQQQNFNDWLGSAYPQKQQPQMGQPQELASSTNYNDDQNQDWGSVS